MQLLYDVEQKKAKVIKSKDVSKNKTEKPKNKVKAPVDNLKAGGRRKPQTSEEVVGFENAAACNAAAKKL